MRDENAITLSHAGLLSLQRAAHIAGAFAFATIVPRFLGPLFFGQYALITSVLAWFGLLSTMGLSQVVARNVPRFVREENPAGLREFFGQLLAARLLGAFLAASCYFILARLFLRDLNPAALLLAAVSLLFAAVADLIFAFFWGLNRAAWWGMGELLRRLALIVLLVPGFLWGGLRGGCMALLVVELLVFATGLWRGRSYLDRLRLLPSIRYLRSYFGFGMLFSLNDLLLTLFQRSGEVLVRMYTSDYAKVGQFALAYAVFLTLAPAVSQIVLSFVPLWASLVAPHQAGELKRWMESLIAWLTAGGMLAVLGLLLLGDSLIPGLLGTAFQPVTAHLLPLILILPILPLTSVAGALVLIRNRPGIALETSALLLGAFWGIAPFSITRWGGVGACWAILLAIMLYAAYFTWRIRNTISIPLGQWAGAVATGVPFVLLAEMLPSPARGVIAFILCSAGYCGLLFLLRIVKPGELTAVWRALRQSHAGRDLPLSRSDGSQSSVGGRQK